MRFPFKNLIFLLALAAIVAGCAQNSTPVSPTMANTEAAPTQPAGPLPPGGEWRSYQEPRLGVRFEIPAGWNEVSPGSLLGPDGFARLEALPTEGEARAARCQLEANREKPARFGTYPEIVDIPAEMEKGALPGCLILPSADQPTSRESEALALLWPAGPQEALEEAPEAVQLLAIRASSAHIRQIAQSLRLDVPGAAQAESRCDFALQETQPLVLRQNGLRMDAFPMARAENCDPLAEPLPFEQRASTGAPAARASAVLEGQWSAERLAQLNARLKPFGFRVETYERLFRVIKNDELVVDNINWIGQMTVKNVGANFMLPMIDSYNASAFLLRPFGVEPLEEWDLLLFDNIFPIFVGAERVQLAYDTRRIPRPSSSPALVQVLRDKEVIDTFSVSGSNPAGGPVRGLWAFQDGWMMELPGVLIQDGALLNDRLGYSEMFAWRLLREKPFYLYRQDGKIQADYDGQALALDFDEVLYEPQWTKAMLLQIKKYENGLLFYARKGDLWYYVVIEAE